MTYSGIMSRAAAVRAQLEGWLRKSGKVGRAVPSAPRAFRTRSNWSVFAALNGALGTARPTFRPHPRSAGWKPAVLRLQLRRAASLWFIFLTLVLCHAHADPIAQFQTVGPGFLPEITFDTNSA